MTPNDILQGRFARALIRRKARRLMGYGLFDDRADVEQELIVRLLRGLAGYDCARGPVNPFVVTLLNRAAAMLLRERLAAKRNATPVRLDLDVAYGSSDPSTAPGAGSADLQLDLAEFLAALPPNLRDLAEILMTETVTGAARTRGMARSSFVRQVERIRRDMEDAGLRIYVE